ncbi:MAG: hypothetical protein WCK32_02570 [Chlorobiaceae bacterium]
MDAIFRELLIMALIRLPLYLPELTPVEHLWDELRVKKIANLEFEIFGLAIAQATQGFKGMKTELIRSRAELFLLSFGSGLI